MARFARAALAAATLLLAGTAVAGSKWYVPVYIYSSNGIPRGAYGALSSARNSPDSLQYIGCSVSTWPTYGTSVYCWARDASGVSLGCSSSDSKLVQVALGASGDSYVQFEADAGGVCTFLNTRAMSYHEPKAP